MARNSERSTRRRQRRRAARILEQYIQAAAPESIELLGDVDLQLEAADGDNGKLARFEMLAYSGGRMTPKAFEFPVVVDLRHVTAARRTIPILRDHDQSQVVGHGKIRTDESGIHAEGVISGAGQAAEEVVAAARRGFPWQVSIGARPQLRFIAAGDSVDVNGQRFDGPIYLSRRTVVREVSFVAVGADDRSKVSIAANDGSLSMSFEQWLKAKHNLEASALTDTQRAEFETQWKADLAAQAGDPPPDNGGNGNGDDDTAGDDPPADPPPEGDVQASGDVVGDMRRRAATERQRIASIEAAGAEFPELTTQAIEAGWTLERFELALARKQLEQLRAQRPTGPAIHAQGDDGADIQAAVIECSIGQSYNAFSASDAENLFPEEVMDRAGRRDRRGYSLHRLMFETIHAAGLSHPIGQIDNEFIEKAFRASQKLEASSGFSTMTLPGILSNVLNKALKTSFERYASIIPFFCEIANTRDFKPFYSYRLESEGVFLKLGPDGEIKHAGLVESEFMNQVATYARMLSLTRQMMINDDLGALTQVVSKLGVAAYKSHELAGVELLLNPPQVGGNDFFSVAHGNLYSGADSALGVDSLSVATQMFMDQTDSEGYPIMVPAERLLVTSKNAILGSQLMTSPQIIVAGSSDVVRTQDNPHVGRYQNRASAWLSNGKVTNSDADAWFLFADPATDMAAFQAAYLNNRQAPTIENSEASFNTLGMQWRGYWDYGFAAQEYRGALRADGK